MLVFTKGTKYHDFRQARDRVDARGRGPPTLSEQSHARGIESVVNIIRHNNA